MVGACKAAGGGFIDEPLAGGPVSVFQGKANLAFNFTCEMDTKTKKPMIRGQITYRDSPSTIDGVKFPEIRLQGTVDRSFVTSVTNCDQAGADAPLGALFGGTYRSQVTTLSALSGRFSVLVFDQGQRGRRRGEITGDGFAIELFGGAYPGYTRGGYIEGGNVQLTK